jgi:hypothetical protein
MKIRSGFVSNSSSSSFCIFGISLDQDELLAIIGKTTQECEDGEDGIYDALEQAEEKLKEKGLNFERGPDYGDYAYVGRYWTSIGDDETGAQFKASVSDAIAEAFGEKKSCSTHEEAWRDG